MKKILFIVFLAASVPVSVWATAGGTYRQSCYQCSDDGTLLSCICPNSSGATGPSSINYSNCPYPISNCGGRLTCGDCAGYNVPFVCGNSSTYPRCVRWNDACFNCPDCAGNRQFCPGEGPPIPARQTAPAKK
jgi:hypothetical protein